MCKCWFRALHLFLYSLAVYSPLSDSSDAALSPLECIGRRRARVRVGVQPKAVDIIKYSSGLCNTGPSGFMQLREITGKRMISCTYEIGKVVT